MARYIPQYIFDGLVARLLMTEVAEKPEIFEDLLQKYFQKYPDENPAALAADLHAAANEGRWVIKVVMDAPDTSYRSEIAVLEALLDVLTKAATLEKPMWRRMVDASQLQPASPSTSAPS